VFEAYLDLLREREEELIGSHCFAGEPGLSTPHPRQQEGQLGLPLKGEIAMLKKAGLLALVLFGLGGALLPTTAVAQDGSYYGRPGYYYSGDRDGDGRWRDHEWREHERREHGWREDRPQEWREHEWREHEWRERQWRGNEWREHERWENRAYRGYYPGNYLYFGYGR
jgi:hypothetical protein